MEELYALHLQFLQNQQTSFRRDFINEVDWDEKLISIQGARGVGKSTLILQHIKEKFDNDKAALYISMDHFILKNKSLYEIAKYHYEHSGTHIFIDEIHKYFDWNIELKSIYDTFPNLKIVFTSSSILQIYKGNADLSRRAINYQLMGLSFREYLQIETKEKFDVYTLDDILNNHTEIASAIIKKIKPLVYFDQYLAYGYYPIYLQGQKSYYHKLNSILQTVLDVDMPILLNINVNNIFKIKKLIGLLASEVPYEPNTAKLAGSLELSRSTLNTYFQYLEQACIFKLLLKEGKFYSTLSKPEKIYLNNTNLCYAISPSKINIGSVREIFFINQVSVKHHVNASKKGDFLVDSSYTFEVGGKNKSFTQIANLENSFIAKAETEISSGNRIPLWLFGFLY